MFHEVRGTYCEMQFIRRFLMSITMIVVTFDSSVNFVSVLFVVLVLIVLFVLSFDE